MKLELVPVIRYWNYSSREGFSSLRTLKDSGVQCVAAFIPWAHLETDRFHLIQKFLRQCGSLGLSVKLGICPEVGIGYPNGGIPDDLLRDRQNLAQDRLGQPIISCVPPNIFPLVSLLAPQVFQKYGHFLLKLVNEVTDILNEGFPAELELVVSDSFFKHYRNAGLPASDHGDYSIRNHLSTQNRREGLSPVLAETVFKTRAIDFLTSRFSRYGNVRIVTHNIFTRGSSMERLLEEIMGAGANPQALFQSMNRARCGNSVVWLDDLGSLRDRERNFLISSAMIMYGNVWVSEDEYNHLTDGFLRKLLKTVKTFSTPEAEMIRPAIAIVQNRFSPAQISTLLQERLGPALKFKTSVSEISSAEKKGLKIVVVEEGQVLELSQSLDLFELAKDFDCTVAVFRSSLCESALREFHKLKNFRLNHGWIFEIGVYEGGGNVLLIGGKDTASMSMEALGESLVSVARLDSFCSFNRGIISVSVDWEIPDEEKSDFSSKLRTIFLINHQQEPKKVSLEFKNPVEVNGMKIGEQDSSDGEKTGKPKLGYLYEAELPPLSVIPLNVVMKVENSKKTEIEMEAEFNGVQAELA